MTCDTDACFEFPSICLLRENYSPIYTPTTILRGQKANGEQYSLPAKMEVSVKLNLQNNKEQVRFMTFFTHDLRIHGRVMLMQLTIFGVEKKWKVEIVNKKLENSMTYIGRAKPTIKVQILESIEDAMMVSLNTQLCEEN